MKNKQAVIIFCSILLAVVMICGAVYWKVSSSKNDSDTQNNAITENSSNNSQTETTVFSVAQLSTFDGKNNSLCYVAISGTVYEIKQGNLWKDGEHTTSNQQAYCGKDLTDVIGKSPHGTSKLGTLVIVGKLQ